MESEHNKFDELFRKGLEKQPSNDFSEQHWDRLANRLERRSRKVKVYSSFFAAAFVAAAVLLFVINTKMYTTSTIINKRPSLSRSRVNSEPLKISKERPWIKQILNTNAYKLDHYLATKHLAVEASKTQHKDSIFSTQRNRLLVPSMKFAAHSYTTSYRSLATNIPIQSFLSSDLSDTTHKFEHEKNTSQAAFEWPKSFARGALTIMAAPDYTNVRGAGNPTLSQNVGLIYTQPIYNNWSISAGILYARKNYQSAYAFYSPKNPPAMSQLPEQVTANCDVLDIPIIANYKIGNFKGLNFVASAGVSSYIMLREKYEFEALSNRGYGSTTSAVYEIRGENTHFLSIADLSMTLEKRVSNKVSVGLRPFIKVPLTGIGYGQTKLESKGLAVNLGLHF